MTSSSGLCTYLTSAPIVAERFLRPGCASVETRDATHRKICCPQHLVQRTAVILLQRSKPDEHVRLLEGAS